MPNHFQLVDKTTGEPEAFNAVDAKLCEHFRAPVHPTEWFNGWYACIGFGLACGKAFAELRATYAQYAEAGGEEFEEAGRKVGPRRVMRDPRRELDARRGGGGGEKHADECSAPYTARGGAHTRRRGGVDASTRQFGRFGDSARGTRTLRWRGMR
jgi:hypothetical protein